MPADLKGKTYGLCGLWDDIDANDWQDSHLRDHILTNFVALWVDASIKGMLDSFTTYLWVYDC